MSNRLSDCITTRNYGGGSFVLRFFREKIVKILTIFFSETVWQLQCIVCFLSPVSMRSYGPFNGQKAFR